MYGVNALLPPSLFNDDNCIDSSDELSEKHIDDVDGWLKFNFLFVFIFSPGIIIKKWWFQMKKKPDLKSYDSIVYKHRNVEAQTGTFQTWHIQTLKLLIKKKFKN